MKLCPRSPLKVPKDFGTRLADDNNGILVNPILHKGVILKTAQELRNACRRKLSSFAYSYKTDPTYNI